MGINDAVKMNRSEAEAMSPVLHTSVLISNRKKWPKMTLLFINSEHDATAIKYWNNAYMKKLESLSISYESDVIRNQDHFSIIEELHDKDFVLSKILVDNF